MSSSDLSRSTERAISVHGMMLSNAKNFPFGQSWIDVIQHKQTTVRDKLWKSGNNFLVTRTLQLEADSSESKPNWKMRLLKLSPQDELSLTEDLIDDFPRYAILSHTWGQILTRWLSRIWITDSVGTRQDIRRLRSVGNKVDRMALGMLVLQIFPYKSGCLCWAIFLEQVAVQSCARLS